MWNDLLNILRNVGDKEAAPNLGSGANLFGTAVEAYGHTIEAIGEHASDTPRGSREELRKRLKSVRHQLKLTPDKPTLDATRKQVEMELRQMGKHNGEYQQVQEREVKEIMAIVATLADSMASREKTYQVRFRGIAKKLRLLTTNDSLAVIRQHLADEVGQLERYCEDMARDTHSALERLKSDLGSHDKVRDQEKATAAVPGEVLDPVSLLHAKTEGETAMEQVLRTAGTYCILRFTISNGPALAQRFSKRVLDNLANAFAQRLKTYFSEAMVLYRASQWDFLAMQQGHLPDAAARAQELELRLSGAYHVEGDAGEKNIRWWIVTAAPRNLSPASRCRMCCGVCNRQPFIRDSED